MDACSLNVAASTTSHPQQGSASKHTGKFGSRLEKNHVLIFLSQFSDLLFTLHDFPQDPEIPSGSSEVEFV